MSLLSNWQNYHLFYHGDRDLLLGKLVAPLAGLLIDKAWIDHFYFVRYALGGPHVRLRIRPRSGHERSSEGMVRTSAESFFARYPSEKTLTVEAIQAKNLILLSDPNEDYDVVFPNNSLQILPLRFELERYGGEDYLERSVDFFAISSVQVLAHLLDHGGRPMSQRLARHAWILARQAWGFASTEDEFLMLLDYPTSYWSKDLAPIRSEGDRVYEARRPVFQNLLLEALLSGESHDSSPLSLAPPDIADASRALSGEVRASKSWRRVCQSHLHMMANRLGMSNPDETYVGRLLWRAAADLSVAEAERWQRSWAQRRDTAKTPHLRELLGLALAFLPSAVRFPKQRGNPERCTQG